MSRRDDLNRFYILLGTLENKLGGKRTLSKCNGHDGWPKRGVYFFFEKGEHRDASSSLRVVRVGTHAVSVNSRTTLWDRLRQHKGNSDCSGGNHRGSIFRLHVGTASLALYKMDCSSWGKGSSAPSEVKRSEQAVEAIVSEYIGQMPFLWLDADDEPSKNSVRGIIERNSIALLSNFAKDDKIDVASTDWRGFYCKHDSVSKSGLWNVNHVRETYDPSFLDVLDHLIMKTRC